MVLLAMFSDVMKTGIESKDIVSGLKYVLMYTTTAFRILNLPFRRLRCLL